MKRGRSVPKRDFWNFTKIFLLLLKLSFERVPSVTHRPLSSTQGLHHFSTQNPSVQHPLQLNPPQFNTALSSTTPHLNTKNPSDQHTDGFLVLDWGVSGVELRNFGDWKGALLCWTEGVTFELTVCIEN